MAVALDGRSRRKRLARGETALGGLVLLIDQSDLSRIIYHALAGEVPIQTVIREARVPRSTFLKRRLKKLGWRTVAGQIIFAKCIIPILRREVAQRRIEILRLHGLSEAPIPNERVTDVASVNDPRTIQLLKQLSPRVVAVNGTRVIDEAVLNAIEGVFLNTHVGITPLYRGVHGGYWALHSGDAGHFGVTIHKIDKRIDTGAIIAQANIRASDGDNFATYPLLQIANAIPLLKLAIRNALNGNLEVLLPPAGQSKLWTHPTAFQYLWGRLTRNIR